MESFTGICIFVATVDDVCQNIVSDLLKKCTFEELHSGEALDVLAAVCENKGKIKVVLTNLHRIEAQITNDILYHIEKKLQKSIYFMSPDDTRIRLGEGSGPFVAYIVRSFCNKDKLNDFWKTSSIANDEVTKAIAMTSTITDFWNPSEATSSTSSSAMPGDASGKKDKVIWTDEMELEFLRAIHTLAPRNVVPRKILEYMNDPRLDKKKVGSHLQKYRLRIGKNHNEASENGERRQSGRRTNYSGLKFTARGKDIGTRVQPGLFKRPNTTQTDDGNKLKVQKKSTDHEPADQNPSHETLGSEDFSWLPSGDEDYSWVGQILDEDDEHKDEDKDEPPPFSD